MPAFDRAKSETLQPAFHRAALRPGKWRLRFRLRSLMAGVLLWGVVLAALLRFWSWTQPYVVTGSYPDGAPSWEMWQRRTLSGRVVIVKCNRWYTNGQKAWEHDFVAKRQFFWSPEGKKLSDFSKFWSYYTADVIAHDEKLRASLLPPAE
jgi:hypothetical protein